MFTKSTAIYTHSLNIFNKTNKTTATLKLLVFIVSCTGASRSNNFVELKNMYKGLVIGTEREKGLLFTLSIMTDVQLNDVWSKTGIYMHVYIL